MARSNTPAEQGGDTASTTVASGKVVKYVGTADVVKISAADFNSVGVEDQKQVVWDAKNKFTVPAADLNEKALAFLDADDDRFVVTDADTQD